jgi:hypothetical protein
MTYRDGLSLSIIIWRRGAKFPFALGPKNFLGGPDVTHYGPQSDFPHYNLTTHCWEGISYLPPWGRAGCSFKEFEYFFMYNYYLFTITWFVQWPKMTKGATVICKLNLNLNEQLSTLSTLYKIQHTFLLLISITNCIFPFSVLFNTWLWLLFWYFQICEVKPKLIQGSLSHTFILLCGMPITTRVVGLNPVHGDVYCIQHYVIKFISDLRHVGDFLLVLRFTPPIKLTATI